MKKEDIPVKIPVWWKEEDRPRLSGTLTLPRAGAQRTFKVGATDLREAFRQERERLREERMHKYNEPNDAGGDADKYNDKMDEDNEPTPEPDPDEERDAER